MEYITAKEAAGKWGISQRRVQVLCEQGRIQGAFRLGWAWAIPKDENKPSDARKMKTKIIRVNVNIKCTKNANIFCTTLSQFLPIKFPVINFQKWFFDFLVCSLDHPG
ncbi:MAG: helix-turn-helix domain-containing protein [Peptococcaceae bacterium]|nr:helix-turn-helix domain-containing protein [Peptococcaceae bacterium]